MAILRDKKTKRELEKIADGINKGVIPEAVVTAEKPEPLPGIQSRAEVQNPATIAVPASAQRTDPLQVSETDLSAGATVQNEPNPVEQQAAKHMQSQIDSAPHDAAGILEKRSEQNAVEQQRSLDSYIDELEGVRESLEQRAADEKAEADAQQKRDYNSAKWSGLTELASSLANLVGVANGASHQTIRTTYSQDWMRQADANRKEYKARLDRIKDMMESSRKETAQARLNGALSLLKQQGQDRLAALKLAIDESNRREKEDREDRRFQQSLDARKAERREAQAATAREAEKERQFKKDEYERNRASQEAIAAARAQAIVEAARLRGKGNNADEEDKPKKNWEDDLFN